MLQEAENTLVTLLGDLLRSRHSTGADPTSSLLAFQALAAQGKGTRSPVNVQNSAITDRFQYPAAASQNADCRSIGFGQWAKIAEGIRQRMEAVSACLNEIFVQRSIPAFLCQSPPLLRLLRRMSEQIGDVSRTSITWGWLASTDLYVANDGQILVMDQNLSAPSGMELLSRLLDRNHAESVMGLIDLHRRLAESAMFRSGVSDTSTAVVFDPCRFNPTFRENESLARAIGLPIVQPGDLIVTKSGIELVNATKRSRVHAIIRRIDDDLLDPNCFRPDSLVGLPGLCKAWRNGNVNLVNPPGSCTANIRSFTRLVPTMIREFLNEEPTLPIATCGECSNVETITELEKNFRKFSVRTNDPMHPARPYFGDSATAEQTSSMLSAVRRDPEKYVIRKLLPDAEQRGFNLRVFSTMGNGFFVPLCGIGRECQSDGGATVAINDDPSAHFVG